MSKNKDQKAQGAGECKGKGRVVQVSGGVRSPAEGDFYRRRRT